MAARHPDRRRRRGRQLHRQLPEPVIGHARRALHRSANHSGAAAKVASRRSGGRGLPSRLSHSGVRPSHQPPAAVPWHSLSSPESRRQRDRTRDRCSAATEYRGTRRDSRPLRLWQWHRRTESGQNPAPVRVRPRWSSRIPTRIAHGFGHEHARVFMEAIGDRAVVPRWRSPHRTPRISTRTRGAPDRMCRLPPGSLQTLPAVEHEARHGVTVEANRFGCGSSSSTAQGGPGGFCERHGKSYLTLRRRGGEGGEGGRGGLLTGRAIPSAYRWAWCRWYSGSNESLLNMMMPHRSMPCFRCAHPYLHMI